MASIDYSYFSFPALAGVDGWPTSEGFYCPTMPDRPFIADPFTWLDPLQTFNAMQNFHAMSIVDPATGLQLEPKSTPPFAEPQSAQLELFPVSSPVNENARTSTFACDLNPSPMSGASSGDRPKDVVPSASSPRPPPANPISEHSSASPAPQKPKRGRPRLGRSTLPPNQHNKRLPHNQIERKYREGINASLERLRKLIPALCQDDKLSGLLDLPRPSKATILDGAIERIQEIEKEREMYRAEIKRLRRTWESAGGRKSGTALGNGSCKPKE